MWICFRCLYTFWEVPVAHSTNVVESDMFWCGYLDLRFTLVPPTHLEIHFEGGFGLFFLCLGSFINFLAQRCSFTFVLVKHSEWRLGLRDVALSQGPATLRVWPKRARFPSKLCEMGTPKHCGRVSPCPALLCHGMGCIPGTRDM